MFKNFRWQIAFWFVGLSTVIYLAFSILGGLYFYNSLTRSMDEELIDVASQIGHAIDLNKETPTFRDWLRVVQTEPSRSLISMQLFSPKGILLEHYGPVGIPKLVLDTAELTENGQTMRIRYSPLLHKGVLVGYLQLQLPTAKHRELAKQFWLTTAAMAPFVLGGFGLCAYFVSGLAVRPIESLFRTLQRFVADAGHELNTPASIMQARADSLERKLSKQGLFAEDTRIISASAERMGVIIRNLMLLAELDSRNFQSSSRIPLDLKDSVQSIMAEFADRFEEKNIFLTTGTFDSATVVADPQALQCIFANLLENAHKYTEPQGNVTVSCATNGNTAHVIVEDTGIGIPTESLPFIFDRFYRVDKSRSRASGGTGLGLSIVKAMVESLSGQAYADSIVGEGSQFHIVLPLHKSTIIPVVAQNLHTPYR